jgi:hypothetical protein
MVGANARTLAGASGESSANGKPSCTVKQDNRFQAAYCASGAGVLFT